MIALDSDAALSAAWARRAGEMSYLPRSRVVSRLIGNWCLPRGQKNLINYMGASGTEMWFGIFYICFFLMTTYTQIPYDALGPELTDNPDDRSRVFFFCTIFVRTPAICDQPAQFCSG